MESFDHSKIATLREYHALRKALNDLGRALDQHGEDLVPGGWPAWLAIIGEIAESTPQADYCAECRAATFADPDGPYWAFKAEVEKGWMVGTYRCLKGHTWTCGYATKLPRL